MEMLGALGMQGCWVPWGCWAHWECRDVPEHPRDVQGCWVSQGNWVHWGIPEHPRNVRGCWMHWGCWLHWGCCMHWRYKGIPEHPRDMQRCWVPWGSWIPWDYRGIPEHPRDTWGCWVLCSCARQHISHPGCHEPLLPQDSAGDRARGPAPPAAAGQCCHPGTRHRRGRVRLDALREQTRQETDTQMAALLERQGP